MFTKELIGHMIEVINARNQDIIGIQGKVVNETKYTLQIKQKNEIMKIRRKQANFQDARNVLPFLCIKTIMKRNTTFRMDGKTIISGSTILKRPEERLKG